MPRAARTSSPCSITIACAASPGWRYRAVASNRCRARMNVNDDVSYERMSGAIGSLLLVWSAIERSAREEVTRFHECLPKSAYGIAAVLRAWEKAVVETAQQPAFSLRSLLAEALCAQLKEHLEVRNGICHGLVGISSAHSGMPATVTWQMNGSQSSICWTKLQASLGWLSKIPSAIAMISNDALERTGSRMVDDSENRAWWLAEFALDLPSG